MCTPTPLFVDFLSKFQDHILFPLALCELPNGFFNIANSLTVCLFTLLLSLSTIQRVTTVGKAKRGLFLLGNVNGKVLLERLEIGTLGDTLCCLFHVPFLQISWSNTLCEIMVVSPLILCGYETDAESQDPVIVAFDWAVLTVTIVHQPPESDNIDGSLAKRMETKN